VVFPSIEFAIFFPLVLAGSWLLMSRPRPWKWFVLAASYLFYGSANPKLCVLLAVVTLGNQAAAVLIHRSPTPRGRQVWMWTAVALDIAVLGVFKYYGFFTDEINGFLNGFGLGLPVPIANIVLPIGISFYTFQAISYTVDVYRGIIEPSPTIDLAVYLAFFPHVVAGPIVRAREILPQIAKPRDPHDVRLAAAVFLIGVGLVKKVAIADFLAREVVDPVFSVPQAYASPDVLLATYAFAAQVYCDFSGYTDMAIGIALLMGIVFPNNFDRPYGATSFRDLWRRWHITLMRFLRDYVYVPIGGSRGGRWLTARNAFLTMLLAGLWHGADWGFIIWGAINGAALAGEGLLRGKVKAPRVVVRWLIVFNTFVFACIFFRAGSLDLSGEILARIDEPGPATLWTWPVVLAVVAVVGLQLLPRRILDRPKLAVERLHPAALGAALATIVVLVGATVPSGGVPPFIYFRF